MELYLDSVDFKEIEAAGALGFMAGLTTTPTFMHREGVKDVDSTLLKLATMVPVLQVEALGNDADEIYTEAKRLLKLGLKKDTTVFKIPISIEGTKACRRLVNEGIMTNLHLVYTLQQAYMACCAGATYVCPLVGRLQDQGQDALSLVRQIVEMVERYNYKTKVMFSSVRHPEHVRNAINCGVHTCTIPWKVMSKLTDNHFTAIGTQQFTEHTRLITVKVGELMHQESTTISKKSSIVEALLKMTESGLGAILVLNEDASLYRVFTDGDLRRNMQKNIDVNQALSSLEATDAKTVDIETSLEDALKLMRSHQVDNLAVLKNGKPQGIIDIQDILNP